MITSNATESSAQHGGGDRRRSVGSRREGDLEDADAIAQAPRHGDLFTPAVAGSSRRESPS